MGQIEQLQSQLSVMGGEAQEAQAKLETEADEIVHLSGEIVRLKMQLDHTASVSGDSQVKRWLIARITIKI